jgi:hypothetical protein
MKWPPHKERAPVSKVLLAVLLTLFISLIFLQGCARREPVSGGPPVSQDPDPSGPEAPSPPLPPEPPQDASPITGEPMVNPGSPVAVAIDNNPDARPQTGLNEADIVYEVQAEGGITRFLAVFHGKSPEVVGPVRSSRPYFALLAKEWGAVFGHCGGDPDLDRYINEWEVVDANEFGLGHLFWRDGSRYMPHNLYTSVENLRKVPSRELASPPKRYEFGAWAEEPETGLQIRYGRSYAVEYRYAGEGYNRYILQGSAEPVLHVDRETEKPVLASNIIVQYASSRVIDDEGRLDIDLEGKGKAAFLLGGVYGEGTWEKQGVSEPTLFLTSGGGRINPAPGQTWVHIVPLDASVELTERP